MKYYCKRCKRFVDESKLIEGDVEWRGIPHAVCPHCHSKMIVEAEQCALCYEYIKPDEEFCDDCKQDMHNAWSTAVASVVQWNRRKPSEYETVEQLILDFLEREVM